MFSKLLLFKPRLSSIKNIKRFSSIFDKRISVSLSHLKNDGFLQKRDFLQEKLENYEEAYRGFMWPQETHFNWATEYFDLMANNNHKPALHIVGETDEVKISYDEMRRRSNQVANFLRASGVKPFDRVMLMLPNVPALWECSLAAIKFPAVILPTSTMLKRDEIVDRLQRGDIQHVITTPEQLDKFDQQLPPFNVNGILVGGKANGWWCYDEAVNFPEEYRPEIQTKASDTLLQYFTSGTTSQPKLVTHTHVSYPIGHLSTMYWLGLKESSIHLNISTPGWGKHAWSSFFAPWNAQATVFSLHFSKFDVEKLLSILENYPITSLCAPPTVWRLIWSFLRQNPSQNYKIHLQQAMSAGEPLNAEVIAGIHKIWGITIREGYGQTETTALIGYCLNQAVIPGTMGYPLPGFQLKLLDEQGNPANDGELAVSRNINSEPVVGIMKGYSDDEKTVDVMRDGLYRTGDWLGYNNGIFHFVGRKDDVFKANGGYRISPFELESVLILHDSILESAVVPSPHPIKGMIPKAFIVLRQDAQVSPMLIDEIFQFLKTKLAPSHMIHDIEVCNNLPKTTSGKIQRVILKEQEAKKYESMNAETIQSTRKL